MLIRVVTISMLLAREKQIWRLKISLCAVGYNYRVNCFEFTIHPAHATIFMVRWTYIIKEQCESACFVDFNRQCKQTTISQHILIKIRRNFTEILFISYFSQWKRQKIFWTKEFCDTINVFKKANFLKTSKIVCCNLVISCFKKWGSLIVSCVQIFE